MLLTANEHSLPGLVPFFVWPLLFDFPGMGVPTKRFYLLPEQLVRL